MYVSLSAHGPQGDGSGLQQWGALDDVVMVGCMALRTIIKRLALNLVRFAICQAMSLYRKIVSGRGELVRDCEHPG